MVYDKRITILRLNEETDEFLPFLFRHANICKTSSKEYLAAGSERSASTFTFQFRYCSKLEDIATDFEKYRIEWKNHLFYVSNGDDVKMKKQKIKIIGQQIHA